MAESYEEAVALDQVYGRPEQDVPFGDYIRGMLTGEVTVADTPPTVTVGGTAFPVTPESLVRGLELTYREDGRIPGTRSEIADTSFGSFLVGRECCVARTTNDRYLRAGATACGGMIFGGFWVDNSGKVVASQVCPSNVSDQDLPVHYPWQETPTRYHGGMYVNPALLSVETARALVESVLPQTPEDFAAIVKDMLSTFAGVKKRQTYWSEEMSDGYRDNEPRDPRAQDILDTLEELDKQNLHELGDDYSHNKSVTRIVNHILAGKLLTLDTSYEKTVIVGAQQLAATWAHLYASRTWAERTSIVR